jgi:hypothetical protein
MSGYTPGPWKVTDDFEEMLVCDERGEELVNVCNEKFFTGEPLPAAENAALIAAAPDLLEALKTLADFARANIGTMDMDDLCAYEAARAAIAKAEGATSPTGGV